MFYGGIFIPGSTMSAVSSVRTIFGLALDAWLLFVLRAEPALRRVAYTWACVPSNELFASNAYAFKTETAWINTRTFGTDDWTYQMSQREIRRTCGSVSIRRLQKACCPFPGSESTDSGTAREDRGRGSHLPSLVL
jgi:hypothetical protein